MDSAKLESSFSAIFSRVALYTLLLCPISSLQLMADPIIWSTSSRIDPYPLSSGPQYFAVNNTANNGPTTADYQGVDQYKGSTLSTTAAAAAERGVLHSSASFSLTPTVVPSSPAENTWGISSLSTWTEDAVHAVDIGPPDLLAGITAYKFTFNTHGTILGGYRDIAVLNDSITQSGLTTVAGEIFEFPPVGPTSFYLQPSNLLSPFEFSFMLYADALSDAGGPFSGSVNFSNTATLASVEAIDSNGNVIPDVYLELGDGTLLGPDGFVPSPSAVPEPSTVVLLGSGILSLVGAARRKLPRRIFS